MSAPRRVCIVLVACLAIAAAAGSALAAGHAAGTTPVPRPAPSSAAALPAPPWASIADALSRAGAALARALGPRQLSPWESGAFSTVRVSLSSSGTQSNGDSFSPSMSDDGRLIAFVSRGSNLVDDDTNGNPDVFVLDSIAWQTIQVSYSANAAEDGGEGAGDAFVSGDGSYVAWAARASYDYPGGSMLCGTPGNIRMQECIFRRDVVFWDLEIADVRPDRVRGDSFSRWPALGFEGYLDAFWSHSTDLVSGDTNGVADVFVRNHIARTTERVSVATGGTQADAASGDTGVAGGDGVAISRDGRFVLFASNATNLAGSPTTVGTHVYLRDRTAGTTERISVTPGGAAGNGSSGLGGRQAISDDGRFVVFSSTAGDLVAGDTNGTMDVFVRDRTTGTTERVSVAYDGAQGALASGSLAAISADGRYVAFNSSAANLVPGDSNGRSDIFVRDRQVGRTIRVSVSTDGAQANSDNGSALWRGLSMTPDGMKVAWSSSATNLVPGDTNGVPDVFVRQRCEPPECPYPPPWTPEPSPTPSITPVPPTATTTPSPTITPTRTPTLTASVTPVPATATATPVSACVCRIVRREVPAAAVQDALANPTHYDGWGKLSNPNRPAGPDNPVRNCLSFQNVNLRYHPMFNGLEWKSGCP
jgi:Tol biopolymer transport system component